MSTTDDRRAVANTVLAILDISGPAPRTELQADRHGLAAADESDIGAEAIMNASVGFYLNLDGLNVGRMVST